MEGLVCPILEIYYYKSDSHYFHFIFVFN